MSDYCANCGELLIGYYAGEEFCQECYGELEDYDDDSDLWDESDEDFEDAIYWAYWAGDVPEPFDELVSSKKV